MLYDRKHILDTAAMLVATALVAGTGHAQTVVAQAGVEQPSGAPTPQGVGSTSSSPAQGTGVPVADAGDIVVTAQRVTSLASKTPVALTAIGGEALRTAGVTNPTQLGDQVPNLSIVRNNGLQITIRGVTSNDNTEKGDPSAAFLLDGIYIARPQVQEVSFYDIARVEVLRGPQGTLYGRNTTAGLVNVITNRPVDRFEAAVNGVYGNFDTIQGDAMVNVPVNQAVALRFSGSYDRRDNYLISNPGEGDKINPFKKNLSGRAQALIKIGGNASLLLRGDYSSLDGNVVTTVPGQTFYSFPASGNPDYIAGPLSSSQRRQLVYATGGFPLRTNDHTWGTDAEFNWNLGPAALTYLGSYRRFHVDENNISFGIEPTAAINTGNYHQNSQELRLATTGTGPLKLQVGGYYFRERAVKSYLLADTAGVPFFGFPVDPVISESYAFFGQGTYMLVPGLRVTGGVRYSHDNKSRIGATVFQQTPVFNPATDIAIRNDARVISSKVTWRAGLDYDLDSRSLLYGVVSTGYKAGGFNDGCLSGSSDGDITCNQPRTAEQLFYRPETITAYEVGLKTRFADNKVRLSASAFYYDYKNLQVSSIIFIGGAPSQSTTNAAKARVKGVELESTLQPSPRNRIDIAATYLDAEYVRYLPLGAGTTLDYAGRPLDRAPKTTVAVGYTYTYPLADGATIAAGARIRLSDSYKLTSFSAGVQFRQPSYSQTDLTMTYSAPKDRYYVQGFVRNLENDVIVTAASYNFGTSTVTPGDPRTYGVRAGFKF